MPITAQAGLRVLSPAIAQRRTHNGVDEPLSEAVAMNLLGNPGTVRLGNAVDSNGWNSHLGKR